MITLQDLDNILGELKQIKQLISKKESSQPTAGLAELVVKAVSDAAPDIKRAVAVSPVHFAALKAFADSRMSIAVGDKYYVVYCDPNAPILDVAIKDACGDD